MTFNLFFQFNSQDTSGEKCVEIVKTLHVKFFPFGSLLPSRAVTAISARDYSFNTHLEFILLKPFFFGCDMQSILIGDLSKLDVSNNDFDDDCLVSNLQYV